MSIPHLEMDAIFWGPNWREPSDEEFFPKVAAALQGESWVLDGNYTRTIPVKWARVQCVIWLDLPFWPTVSRVIVRSARRAARGEELWKGTGNRESWRKCFLSRDSIVWWAIQSHRKNKQQYAAMMTDPQYAHIQFLRLRSAREIDRFLSRIRDA
jgi:adenylate kinase family enzyme